MNTFQANIKVAVFSGQNNKLFEEEINKFLAEHQLDIVNIQYNATEADHNCMIVYIERED